MYQKIDLYQRAGNESWLPKSVRLLALTWSSVLVAYAVWAVVLIADKNASEEELASVNMHNTTLAQQIEKLSNISKDRKFTKLEQTLVLLQTQLLEKKNFIQHLQDPKLNNLTGFSDVFYGLARQHQPGLSLSKIEIKKSGSEFSMMGTVEHPADVPAYVVRLGSEDVFDDMIFEKLRISESVLGDELRFEIHSSSQRSAPRASLDRIDNVSLNETLQGPRS